MQWKKCQSDILVQSVKNPDVGWQGCLNVPSMPVRFKVLCLQRRNYGGQDVLDRYGLNVLCEQQGFVERQGLSSGLSQGLMHLTTLNRGSQPWRDAHGKHGWLDGLCTHGPASFWEYTLKIEHKRDKYSFKLSIPQKQSLLWCHDYVVTGSQCNIN